MHDEDLDDDSVELSDIAIVGMACRFPGAENPQQYWENLKNGVESVVELSDAELRAEGVSEDLLSNPHYVKRAAVLKNMEYFDAGFFNFGPLEATMMDPQHRQFLECTWETLESAGYDPSTYDGAIGVFAGSGHNAYMPYNLFTNPQFMQQHGMFLVRHTGNDKDFLTTRASYCFNLKGPSINVQTACSTSLVAMHLAVQSLMSQECDLALAGGVTIEMPHRQGYLFLEGEILSPDGHCRAFDAQSKGTVFGSGVGMVALKRLSDALDDGDTIHAVIKASAINNDGSGKASYMAPSVDGQAAAVHEALTVADIDPETIDYVECHGTGTPIGDPIELAALTTAYRQETQAKQFCGVGSVKSNIGHLDTAAGVASVIKVVQSLKHRQLPPSINFSSPNPAVDWANSPFMVNASLKDWVSRKGPRRAGINSLGVGGTNAHVILEEAPEMDPTSDSRATQLFVLSARTRSALDAQATKLADALKNAVYSEDAQAFADAAYTLKVGRRAFEHRRAFTAATAEEALALLQDSRNERVFSVHAPERQRDVAFMMAGGGAQYPNMGLDLYQEEPVYRAAVDQCLSLIGQFVDFDLRSLMFPADDKLDYAATELQRPSRSVTSLFITQYAQAKLWESWGISPSALIGHSLGENTAACLAGVFSLKDALGLVALRGKLFEQVPDGGMLSVQLGEAAIRKLMPASLDIAAVNGPELTVVSGPVAALETLQQQLEQQEVECQRVRINIAAHSRMLEPILEEFRRYLKSIKLSQPSIRIVSNLTGDWLCPIKASTADYWVDHLRNTVRFGDGVEKLLADNPFVLVEVGPGRTLSSLARMAAGMSPQHHAFQSMRTHSDDRNDQCFMLETFGKLWAVNAKVKWAAFYGDEVRRRIPLPTYAFEHKKYWIEPGAGTGAQSANARRDDIHAWGYQPVWEPAAQNAQALSSGFALLVGESRDTDALKSALNASGVQVMTATAGTAFALEPTSATLDLASSDQWTELLTALLKQAAGQALQIVFLQSLNIEPTTDSALKHGFEPLLALGKALSGEELTVPVHLTVITQHALAFHADQSCNPFAALVSGPVTVMPAEIKGLVTRHLDVDTLNPAGVARELATARASASAIIMRGKRAYVRHMRAYDASSAHGPMLLAQNDTVLITGGLGGLGMEMAKALIAQPALNLVLVNRRAFPDESAWEELARQPGAIGLKAGLLLALRAAGHQIMVQAVDISDAQDVARLKQAIVQRFGKLDAIVHTAGVIDDGLMAMKDMETVSRVLAPKVQGTRNLLDVFDDQPLKRVVLFSSSSSYSGLAGQIDYAAANAFLDAVAQSACAEGRDHVIAINWPAWRESGMASRIVTRQLDMLGGQAAKHPWLGVMVEDTATATTYQRSFGVSHDWVLSEHRLVGPGCLLPGTSYLELGRAAYNERFGAGAVSLSNVIFLSPCFVGDSEEVVVQTQLVYEQGKTEFVVSSYRDGDWVEHARGNVGPADVSVNAASLSALRETCTRNKPVPARGTDQANLQFGKRWHCARRIALGEGQAIIDLSLGEEFCGDLDWALLHPALLDIATAGAQDIVPNYDVRTHFLIPLGYSKVSVLRPLTSSITSHIQLHDGVVLGPDSAARGDTVTFNISIMDDQGQVLVKVEDFTMKCVVLDFSGQADAGVARRDIDPLLQATMSMGIGNQEGQDVFRWVLDGVRLPQLAVSPFPVDVVLETLRAAVSESSGGEGSAISVDRDAMSEDFVEPETDLQKEIAAIWRETLGVDRVGIKDNFFELGGHSLLLTRVGTKLKKKLKKELPMSAMFKDPTVEKWAAVLAADSGEPAAPKSGITRVSRDALRKKRT